MMVRLYDKFGRWWLFGNELAPNERPYDDVINFCYASNVRFERVKGTKNFELELLLFEKEFPLDPMKLDHACVSMLVPQ